MKSQPFRRKCGFCLGLTLVLICAPAWGAEPSKVVQFGEALILPPAGRGGRVAISIDPVSARIAAGAWQSPKAGEKFPLAEGRSLTWNKLSAGADGSYQSRALSGGQAFFTV